MKEILKKKWIWILYMVIFGAFSLQRAIDFFSPGETPFLYYQILMIFSINEGWVPTSYIFTIASVVLNIAMFILLWFYIFEKRFFSVSFIVLILISKIISDSLGHSFELNIIKSLFYESNILAWQVSINLFLWLLPSYLALADYIVKKMKTNRAQKKALKNFSA
ncbi:MAG: hypothetical protein AB1650_01170 [Candidatus Omnitrophota bacterium]